MLFVFWLGVNFLIGYAIGKPKGQAGTSAFICVLLGPIGWIIALCSKGHTVTCPFCAESIRSNAVICRHCHRELPPALVETESSTSFAAGLIGLIGVLFVIGFVVIAFRDLRLTNQAGRHKEEITPAPVTQSSPPRPAQRLVQIQQNTAVKIPYGEITIPKGTRLSATPLDATSIRVRYADLSLDIPISATDFAAR